MKGKQTFPGLWMLCLAAVGIGMLLLFRGSAEQADRACAAAFLREDVTFLAKESGLSEQAFLAELEAGAVYVIEEDGLGYGPDGQAAFAAGLDARLMDGRAHTDPGACLRGQTSVGMPQLVVENITRAGVHGPRDYDAEVFGYGGRVIRGVYLFPNYRDRLAGEDPSAIADLLFLAATDRGMRLLILRPFEDGDTGAVCTDPAVYRRCLADLGERLEARGLTLGEGLSSMEARTLDRTFLWLLLAGGAPVLAGVWLLCRWRRLAACRTALLLAAWAAVLLFWLWDHGLTQKLLMLAAAVLLPSVGVWQLAAMADGLPRRWQGKGFLHQSLLFAACVTGWALVGGLSVAALMSGRSYLLSSQIFSGVKLALLGPVALMGVLLLWRLRGSLIPRDRRSLLTLLAAAAAGGVILLALVLRSGDGGPVSGLERAFRVWLERVLYARPRTKELLLAAPCMPVFLWACRKKRPRLQLVCGLGCALELTSVCNTFCHATAPLRVSAARTLLGAGLGLAPGLLVCLVLEGLVRWSSRRTKSE